QLQLLSAYLRGEARQSRNVAARPCQAGDNPRAHRVIIKPHDNRNRCSCFFSGTGRRWTTRNNSIQLETHELSRECGDAIEFPLRISLLNDDVFAPGVSKLPWAF